MPIRFVARRRGVFRARLVPPPALAIDPSPEVRAEIKARLKGAWTEFEFGPTAANGNVSWAAPPDDEGDDDATVVN